MQRLRDPAAESAGRQSQIGEIMRNLLRRNKYHSRKAMCLKNKQSKFFEHIERSSITVTAFEGRKPQIFTVTGRIDSYLSQKCIKKRTLLWNIIYYVLI